MSFTEEWLGHASAKKAVILLVGTYVLYRVWIHVDQWSRLRALPGTRAPQIPVKLPWGLDFMKKQFNAANKYSHLEFWRGFLGSSDNWTAETTVAGRKIVFTADVENIKAILATQFGDYGKGKRFHELWESFLGDSIFSTDGQKWHDSRQLIRPQFTKDRISDLECFETHLETFFKAVANGGALESEYQKVDLEAGNGQPLDISELLFRYTLDVATDFLLGKSVNSMTQPRQEFAEAFNEVQHVQHIIYIAGPLNALVPRRTYHSGLKVIDEFCNKYIDRALRLSPEELASNTKSQRYTFLHELASFTRDRKVIRDQIVAVLLAGRDTTAATLSWTLYELGRHPEVVKRLRQEIIEHVGLERLPTYADLKNMKYLQNIMNETLRLYPAVPFNVRLALKDCTLPRGGGPDGLQPVSVLKDTPIGYSTLVMQRREDLYPPASEEFADPSIFSPERWYVWQPRPWQYVPFNGGPRICVGQQFALTEMGYVLVRMFQRFERVQSYMDDIDGGEPKLKADIVLQPGDGVKVAFWEADRK